MKTVAIYNLKGGVGKTSMAVNLAALSSTRSARRTLLWDLDAQRAASWLLGDDKPVPGQALSIFDKSARIVKSVRPTRLANVDVIAADDTLRAISAYLDGGVGRRRLTKLIADLEKSYDRLILDCAPGLETLTDQILRAADIVIVPIIPSPLSERAFDAVVAHVRANFGKKEKLSLLPVFSMVDRRRTRHRDALEAHADWPSVPMASAVEQMGERQETLFDFAPHSPAAQAYARLWRAVEMRLDQAD